MQRIGSPRALARPLGAAAPACGRLSSSPRWLHPRFRRLPPPVIVMGMHRSGTSLVAGMLGALGVYVGPEFDAASAGNFEAVVRAGRLSGYAEAAAFFRLNEQLLRAGRASWCRVEPFLRRRSQDGWLGAAELCLRAQTCGSLLRDFLAPLPEGYSGAWGWKDPRNSLTLPLWLRLFPEARIVHVRRDPEAVVRSLHQRARLWQAAGAPPGTRSQRSAGSCARSLARKLGVLAPLQPDPCLDPDYCRELYRVYEDQCAQVRDRRIAYHRVGYEEILADPEQAAERLAQFAGTCREEETIRRAASLVLQER